MRLSWLMCYLLAMGRQFLRVFRTLILSSSQLVLNLIAESANTAKTVTCGKAPIEPGTDGWWGRGPLECRAKHGGVDSTSTCIGRKGAKVTKERLSVSFQLFEWYNLDLGSFVKLPNLAKCPNPSWSFGQLQAAWRGGSKSGDYIP